MNLIRLHELLAETTVQLRNGEVVHGDPHLVEAIRDGKDLREVQGGVVTIDAMPHFTEAPATMQTVDMELLVVGVDRAAAEAARSELIGLLRDYPRPDRLAGGPSYIEVGAEIGDQGAAFQLFALGKVLGLWDIITPAMFGLSGEEARQAAGGGFVMMSGYAA